MRKIMILAGVLLAIATPGFAYEKATVTAAQQALVRLGYDPGPVSGSWNGKTRDALNDLRKKNGLPPAKDFVGSSLQLVHKLSPGQTTLPHPGLLVTDLKQRQSFIKNDMSELIFKVCSVPVGIGIRPNENPAKATVDAFKSPKGYIPGNEDWYNPISEGLVEAQARCMVGETFACESILTMAKTWADGDALRSGVKKSTESYEDVSWVADGLLRDIITAYATASTFVEVPVADNAKIIDWLKRRVDEHHVIRTNGKPKGSINDILASNHATTRMMPAMLFGALVGDRSMMEPAFNTWRYVLSSMRPDGSLPTETRRGARWFHYSTTQIAQLITILQVASAQGIDLQATSPKYTIPMAVSFVLKAMADFDLAIAYAKVNYVPGESDDYKIPFVRPFHFGFIPAYQAVFGDDANIQTMRTGFIDTDICTKPSFDEEKLINYRACGARKPGSSISFANTVSKLGLLPDKTMGYPAGCFVGQQVNVLDTAGKP